MSTSFRFLLWILCWSAVHGALRFANYYQDHMVLQRAPERAVVWGYSDTFNTPIFLTLNGRVYPTTSSSSSPNAQNASIWSVTLDPQTQEGPFQVKVTRPLANGTLETIVLTDVLFGDVWICSGQSNMGFSVNRMLNASAEIQNANRYPKIRLFAVKQIPASVPQEELLGINMQWSLASNNTVANGATSAVCWLYGRMIHEGLGERPVGLIHTSWGGTEIEFWTPPEVFKECAINATEPVANQENHRVTAVEDVVLNNTNLYNAMIYPLTRLVIKGAIWYQGESNAGHNRDQYNCTFAKMIEAWRAAWHTRTDSITDPAFPFGFVQLSTYDTTGTKVGGFPWIRWHQTFDVGSVPNSKVANVFMAVALDLRDDVGNLHPRTKLDVGYRLSRSGLAVAYGYKNVTYLGPIIANISVAADSGKINVTYSNEASPSIELRSPSGFEVCCVSKQVCTLNDMAWVNATASRIEGAPLTISLDVDASCASKPIVGLRYLWKETPCLFKQATIYNSVDANLPAPPYIQYF